MLCTSLSFCVCLCICQSLSLSLSIYIYIWHKNCILYLIFSDIYSCETCVYRTDNPLAMRRHKLIHKKRANMTFSCNTCQETFNQLSDYNAHLMKKHNVRTFLYQCKMCGKMEQCSGSLKKHVAGHLRVKEIFGCDQCNYEAGRRWNLLRHKVSF